MKQTFLDSCHMLYGNKGAVWTDQVHICETGFSSSTLCGVPMLSTNWAAQAGIKKPGCLKCRTIYACKNAKREDLIKVCANNDHNGVYRDEDCIREFSNVATKEDLTAIIIMWVIEEQMNEKDINELLRPYAKI